MGEKRKEKKDDRKIGKIEPPTTYIVLYNGNDKFIVILFCKVEGRLSNGKLQEIKQ